MLKPNSGCPKILRACRDSDPLTWPRGAISRYRVRYIDGADNAESLVCYNDSRYSSCSEEINQNQYHRGCINGSTSDLSRKFSTTEIPCISSESATPLHWFAREIGESTGETLFMHAMYSRCNNNESRQPCLWRHMRVIFLSGTIYGLKLMRSSDFSESCCSNQLVSGALLSLWLCNTDSCLLLPVMRILSSRWILLSTLEELCEYLRIVFPLSMLGIKDSTWHCML